MPVNEQVWIVDDDSSIRWVMEKALTRAGLDCRAFESGTEVTTALEDEEPMVVVSDIRMPGMDGIELLSHIKAQQPNLPVIITTAHSDLDSAVSSYEEGAFEYLPKPFDIDEMVATVKRAQSQRLQIAEAGAETRIERTTEIIGNAPAMQEVFRAIGRLAHSHITVLINGESGTGKELVARNLHRLSTRAEQPFVKVNCAAFSPTLIESELFGHEKGAFTGANERRKGRFELAHGGTLFLDEIGELPLEAQSKLLRVLQEREFERVGGSQTIAVDIRVVAATNRDLWQMVEQGKFRMDLYYRLNVFPIQVPALRERIEDIPQLANNLIVQLNKKLGKQLRGISKSAINALQAYTWPGNIRELQNVLEREAILAKGRLIELTQSLGTEIPQQIADDLTLEQAQAEHILKVVELCNGKIAGANGAAQKLGLPESTLRSKMKKLKIR